jgi:hypothetical protein
VVIAATAEDRIARRSRIRAEIARCAIAGLLASTAMFAYAGSVKPNAEGAVWSCLSNPKDATIYMSGVFESHGGMATGVDVAFTQMLASRYGVKTSVVCSMAQPGPTVLAKAQSDQKSYAGQLTQQGKKVIETGWVFAPNAAALPYVCAAAVGHGSDGHNYNAFVITQILAVSGTAAGQISGAWTAHLASQYPPTAISLNSCDLMQADLDKAKGSRQSTIDKYKALNMHIVEDGWTFGGGVMTTTQPATSAQPSVPSTSVAAPAAGKPAVGSATPSTAVGTHAKPTLPAATVATAPPSAADHPAAAHPTAPIAAVPPAAKEFAYICQTGHYSPPPNRHFTRYQSGIVHTTNDLKSVTTAWRNYLISTYHLTGQVGGTCLEAGPTTDAILAGWAQQRAGQQVEDVKVDWHG